MGIFSKNTETTQQIEDVKTITSKDIQSEMERKLDFVLSNNNINLIEEKVKSFEDNNKHITTKGKRLSSLGFNNTPSSVKAQNIEIEKSTKIQEISATKKEIELTNKYAIEYPGYKFVPERIFNQVCEQYDLYTSEPRRYIKEIPEKNLSEIENFVKDKEQMYEIRCSYAFSRETYLILDNLTEEKAQKEYDTIINSGYTHDTSYFVEKKQNLEITAPINHFDLKDTEIRGRRISAKKVEDPIVSYLVDGGRIIVSVWDKEAEIPEIKNENWN